MAARRAAALIRLPLISRKSFKRSFWGQQPGRYTLRKGCADYLWEVWSRVGERCWPSGVMLCHSCDAETSSGYNESFLVLIGCRFFMSDEYIYFIKTIMSDGYIYVIYETLM